MILLILLIVALPFWIAVRRFRLLAAQGEADETRESIISRELILSQLKGLFSRRRPPPVVTPPPYLILSGPADDPRLIIRRAYQTMLDWAQARSLSRAPTQTPALYAEALNAAVPQAGEAVTILTDAYVRARYDVEPIPPGDARRAQMAAEQLQAITTAE